MSYARFSAESDIYLFAHAGGFVQCCGCPLAPYKEAYSAFFKMMVPDLGMVDLHSPEEVVAHLEDHREAGHNFPLDLLDPGTYTDDVFKPFERGSKA